MINNPDFLIVYGTLRPPFDNAFAQYLRQKSRLVGKGTFTGQVYDIGSYPGAIYQATGNTDVHGTVFDVSHQKDAILTYLDYYEGVGDGFELPTEFIRAIVPVQLDNQQVFSWVYLYNLSTDDKSLIDSGDYALYISQLQQSF